MSRRVNALIRAALTAGYRVLDSGVLLRPDGAPAYTRTQPGRRYRLFSFRGYPIAVHKLAAYQWFGARAFRTGIHVRHLDDVGDNNRRDNLRLGTQSQNEKDKARNRRRERNL